MVMKFHDIASMVSEAIRDHRNLRNIISLLYDEDMGQRLIAAKALGEIARREPELMKQRWERLFRAFDDTMSCWGAAEALKEVGRNECRTNTNNSGCLASSRRAS